MKTLLGTKFYLVSGQSPFKKKKKKKKSKYFFFFFFQFELDCHLWAPACIALYFFFGFIEVYLVIPPITKSYRHLGPLSSQVWIGALKPASRKPLSSGNKIGETRRCGNRVQVFKSLKYSLMQCQVCWQSPEWLLMRLIYHCFHTSGHLFCFLFSLFSPCVGSCRVCVRTMSCLALRRK